MLVGTAALGSSESWIKFRSGNGAIVLTFLAGAELDPKVFRLKWKQAGAVGLASFFLPLLGCAAAAHWLLGWGPMASWLAGIAMSATSVAVAVEVESEGLIEHSRTYHKRLPHGLKRRGDRFGVKPHVELLVEHPAQQILEYAERVQADMIVVGHRGRGAFDRWRLGW